MTQSKIKWSAVIQAVQPRIRLERSFDERYRVYLGFHLWLHGTHQISDWLDASDVQSYGIAIGTKTQEKHLFRAGDEVHGLAHPVADDGTRPTTCMPPTLPQYRERSHRRLSARRFSSPCKNCIWGCKIAGVMNLDHWNPGFKRYRIEPFAMGRRVASITWRVRHAKCLVDVEWFGRRKTGWMKTSHHIAGQMIDVQSPHFHFQSTTEKLATEPGWI